MGSSDVAAPKPGKRPFWMHQIAEYLLGAVLIAQGLQSPTPTVPALAGALIVVNVAIVRGPLSAFNVVSRSTHRVLDLVVIVVVAVLAVQPWFSVESTTRALMLVISAVMGFIWWQSSFAEKPKKVPKGGSTATPPPASTGSPATPAAASTGDRSTDMGRRAGRAAAAGVLGARRLKSSRKS